MICSREGVNVVKRGVYTSPAFFFAFLNEKKGFLFERPL